MFKKKTLTPASLGIRTMIGAYLLYLAYTLIPAIQKAPDTKELVFWIAVVVVFTLVGVLAIVFSVRTLIKGEYDKGVVEEPKEEIDSFHSEADKEKQE